MVVQRVSGPEYAQIEGTFARVCDRSEMGGTESVWDYPRPPRLERTTDLLRVVHRGITLAETHCGQRVLETSHPPVFYFPPEDVRMDLLRPASARQTFCEFKGVALYWDLVAADAEAGVSAVKIGWSYPEPTSSFAALLDHIAFYASKLDECWVAGERVQAQAGDFYGGWITSRVRGPFKGGPGTMGW